MADSAEPARTAPALVDVTRSAVVSQDGGPSLPVHAAPVLSAGDLVGRYRIRRLLGEGGMGHVYLARDLSLGRSVALKMVRPDWLNERDTQRFILEARTTARFSHPHIVVLYDVGEHRGTPYLALEYLDGQSLKQRALRETLSVDETLRIGRAVADALEHAHARGVRHCDLKPSNVMLPSDGRLRVVDFGLALSEAGAASTGAGTPDWMAPEQWRREPLTDAVDVWALGVMLFQLLELAHPFGPAASPAARRASVLDATRPPEKLARKGVPPDVADAIRRALSASPAARPSAAELCAALDRALAGGASAASDAPYRGLSAFGEEHAHSFFAREAEIELFLERLRSTPILPIIGPSGAGKSSFLHAGVVPRLKAQERWTVINARPGSKPFEELAHCLLTAAGVAASASPKAREELAAELASTPTLLALRLSTIAAASQSRVLLAVDQLEEIFTHDVADADVQRFLELLANAADDRAEPVRVVVTLRDDFLGRVTSFRQLFVLKKLGPEALRQAIVGPLARSGFRFEQPEMVDNILREVGDASAGLPLLQFACSALWDARDTERGLLLASAYQRMGGVAGALAQHADSVMAELSTAEQRIARQLLTRLVFGTRARRVVDRSLLLASLGEGAEPVLGKLLSARLLVQRRPHGEGVTLVELAHESLMQSWAQLARWLEESSEERRLLHELEEAASFWEKRNRRPEETWAADDIAAARKRVEQLGVALPARVETFLTQGEQHHAAIRKRARTRTIAAVAAALVVTIASLAAANEYRKQKVAAEQQADALRLAGGNLGRVDLVLRPFDWQAGAAVAVAPTELPGLAWSLHALRPGDVHKPGDALRPELVRIHETVTSGEERTDHIEAPGGGAFLRIDGRGRAGEDCAPSWIRLQALPGFAERTAPTQIVIPVPTCRASRAGVIEVPEGQFIYGGAGEPHTKFEDYVEPERLVSLPTYFIDRTEVSNAAFQPFGSLAAVTGYPTPQYPMEGVLADADKPERPLTAIDAYAAEAFCRFMGKRLPGDFEWAKAARGGLMIGGRPNPFPRRLYPWGPAPNERCVNQDGDADAFGWVAPVDAFPCGASPYGVLQLAGNVAEWISREGQTNPGYPLRIIRGGAVDSPKELEQTTTVFRNGREARYFSFAAGVRCIMGGQEGDEGKW